MTETRKESTIERHVQTILGTLITGGIIGCFTLLQSMSLKLAKMEERDGMKNEKIEALQSGMNRVQMDLQDVKDRMTRIESNQNASK